MTAQDKALKENTASAPLQIVAPGTCVETGEQAALVLGMYDHLVETIHQYNPSADFAQIDKAFRYADTHHNGQLRKDGSPFITHPLAVAQIIAEELRLDSESIEAALMHDCIEDTSATYAEIAKEFSPAVADLVEGLSNCLVKFSKCCTPVPGDEIVGFITRGYGVSVHRCDCPNAAIERRKPEERGRWIKVSWGTDVKESYQTALDIYAKDRLDLVLDVSAALSSSQTRVASINATTTADGFAVIHLSIFISDAQHLAAVMRRLHQISGVMKVDRPAG